MSTRLRTRAVHSGEDIQAFFDRIAQCYGESHGNAQRLLQRRLHLIRRLLGSHAGGVLLDIGCGPGVHLLPLATAFRRAIGVDLSAQMIAAAERMRAACGCAAKIELHVTNADNLSCVDPQSVDVALCAGALEHMSDQRAVLAQVNRVLKPGGRFVCLTVNGDHVWYRMAASLGYDVKHLSSDVFLGVEQLQHLLGQAGLKHCELGYWNFVAKGDMPPWAAWPLQLLELVGRAVAPRALRGGLYACAVKTQ